MLNTLKSWLGLLLIGATLSSPVQAERLKDITTVAGVRSNQLVGYGLVVGAGWHRGWYRFYLPDLPQSAEQLWRGHPSG